MFLEGLLSFEHQGRGVKKVKYTQGQNWGEASEARTLAGEGRAKFKRAPKT